MAGVKMAYFDQFFKSFSLDDEGEMVLALADGTLLARRPFDETKIGRSWPRTRSSSMRRKGPSSATR